MFFRMNIACQSIIGLVFMKSIVNRKYETFKGKNNIYDKKICRFLSVVCRRFTFDIACFTWTILFGMRAFILILVAIAVGAQKRYRHETI